MQVELQVQGNELHKLCTEHREIPSKRRNGSSSCGLHHR